MLRKLYVNDAVVFIAPLRLPPALIETLDGAMIQEPDALDSLKMEVGIEDCLHIEFEYDKSAYHLQDVVIGKVS